MKAIQELSSLAIERKRELYPNIPEYAIPKPKYSDSTANGLTQCIIDYLRLNGWYAVRINTMGMYKEDLGKYVKSQTTKGTADIHACINGIHVSIEVKIGRDTQSDFQKETETKVKQSGGQYIIAKDFENFLYWYNYNFKSIAK